MLFAAQALVDGLFGDNLVHEDVMFLHGDLVEQLTFERECHQRCVMTSVFEHLVVITLAVSRFGTV